MSTPCSGLGPRAVAVHGQGLAPSSFSSQALAPLRVPRSGAGALLPAFLPPWDPGAGFLCSLMVDKAHVATSVVYHSHGSLIDGFFKLLSRCPPRAHSGTPLPLGCLTKSPNNSNPGHHAFPKLLPTRSIAPRSPRTEPGPPQQPLHFPQVSPSQGCFPEPCHCSKSWACSALCLIEGQWRGRRAPGSCLEGGHLGTFHMLQLRLLVPGWPHVWDPILQNSGELTGQGVAAGGGAGWPEQCPSGLSMSAWRGPQGVPNAKQGCSGLSLACLFFSSSQPS